MADADDIRPGVVRAIASISSINIGGSQNITFRIDHLDQPLNEGEMVAIAEALSCSTKVEKVNLSGVIQGSPAMATSTFLKTILENHPSIREIKLSWNNLYDNFSEVIGRALKTNSSLKELNLNCNSIGPHGAEMLAEGLRHNKALKILHLYNNHLCDRGARALAQSLSMNKTLEDLNIGLNMVTANSVKSLAPALEKSCLKELSIGGNNLKDEGGKALALSLIENKSLTNLYLEGTDIGDETCKAIAAALCHNPSLKVLGLNQNNSITDVGATAIEEALEHLNHTVETIYLIAVLEISDNQRDRINHLCDQNRRLNTFFQHINENIPAIPFGAWPRILDVVECKPDLLYALLKTKPELCQEQQQRRRHQTE